MKSLISELKRRNVIRVTVAYIVTAWLLVQVLELATDAFGAPDWTLKLVITLLALGLVPTVVFSWVYELTPDGVRRESEITPEQSISHHTARRLNWAVLVLLVAAIALFVADRMALFGEAAPASADVPLAAIDTDTPVKESQASSVAVLPFVDLSPGTDQGYFSDGIAEEILNVLVRVDGLAVASRTSSFQFKGRDLGIPQIADSLKVRHILEGSVRKAGDTLRITAQLIDTANDRHLWSETYDRALTAENVFEIQDEIASAIVSALANALEIDFGGGVESTKLTENLTAYELYLQARALFQTRTRLLEADEMLVRALALDPDFIDALEMRAGIHAIVSEYEQHIVRGEAHRQAEQLVAQVLALDPDSAMAYAVRGNIGHDAAAYLRGPGNWQQILGDMERAAQLDPNSPEAHNWKGLVLNTLGRVEEALVSFQRCRTVEPFYRPCAENMIVMLAALGRDQEALAAYNADLDRGLSNPIWLPLGLLARLDRELLFKSITNGSDLLLGWPRHDEFYAAYRSGKADPEMANDALRVARTKKALRDDALAIYLTPVGAFDLIPYHLYMWDASFAAYRRSPQFKSYLRKSGIERYWRTHGFPDRCSPLGDSDFECT